MWSNAKIMRKAKRALKRTECYLESRAASKALGYECELDYVLAKPGAAIAYAHCADDIIIFDPLKSDAATQSVADWSFSLDSDLFSYLERGYELVGMSLGIHYEAWLEINSRHKDGGINYLSGMQQYLRYCKRNGIAVELLREKFQYEGIDVMALCDKPALEPEPSKE